MTRWDWLKATFVCFFLILSPEDFRKSILREVRQKLIKELEE